MTDKKQKALIEIEIEGIGTVKSVPGINLRGALRGEGVFLDGTCADRGECGRCVVRVIEGDVAAPEKSESGLLGREAVSAGDRLACRIILTGNLKIGIDDERLLELDRTGRWKDTFGSVLWQPEKFIPEEDGYGYAIDMGTSSLAAALYDMRTGRPMDIISAANPLIPWGEDIISRLGAYNSGDDTSSKMRATLWKVISGLLKKLCFRNGISGSSTLRAVFVGNTAIHHIALGLAVKSLMEPPFGPDLTEIRICSPSDLGVESISNLPPQLVFPPPIGGFVGSDATVSLQAALLQGRPTGAIIDIGTNCEIAVWQGERILVTSAAAGPAFEGGEIHNGMRADTGAIFSVRLEKDEVRVQVVGGGKPVGICGTGIVDVVSEMVRLGLVDRSGLVQKDSHPMLGEDGLILDESGSVIFTPGDVEAVQKAKAAVSAAFAVLMAKMDLDAVKLETVYVSGAFGSMLDVKSAMGIGLLPNLPEDRYALSGNSALVGASFCLLSSDFLDTVLKLTGSVEFVSIADEPDFEGIYIENLFFR